MNDWTMKSGEWAADQTHLQGVKPPSAQGRCRAQAGSGVWVGQRELEGRAKTHFCASEIAHLQPSFLRF